MDGQTLFRESLAEILRESPAYDVVGQAASTAESVGLARALRPDIVLTELSQMGVRSRVQHIRLICRNNPTVKVIVITASEAERDYLESFRAGAVGFIAKATSAQAFLEQLDRIASGGSVTFEEVALRTGRVHNDPSRRAPHARKPRPAASTMDIAMLDLVAMGMTNREIAEKLSISERSVGSRLHKLIRKFKLTGHT